MGEKNKKGKVFKYIVGSIALCTVATVAIIKGMPYVTGAINKSVVKHSNKKSEEDDWGPVIEKKQTFEEDEINDD